MHEEHGTQTSFIITPCPCQRCSPPRRGPLRPAPSKLDHVVGGRRNDELAPPLHHRAAQVERRLHAGSRPRRTPRSRPVFGSRPRRYSTATVSAVSGRPGKASGGHRKDAGGMSASCLVMALSVSRLGQGQAREAGTEKSDVSGISLSRAECSTVYALAVGQPE